MSNPTTARAQRQAAARDGRRDDAVERRVKDANPRGSDPETTTRQRQIERQREIAEEVDVDRDGVGAVDRIGQGIDVFLRSAGVRQFGTQVREDFAGEADFVQPGDVDPRVDGQRISAEPRVARNRRSDVADRARRETAAEAEFVEPDDLQADVGARGVTDLEIPDDRRPDVADRTRESLAGEDPFAEPGDFDVTVTGRGVEAAGLTDDGAQRRAGRQFESETALRSVDPFEDLRDTDDGFGLTDEAQQRQAARGFESQLELFDTGTLGSDDVREFDDGFGLARDPARRLAAARIDEQLPDVDVSAGDIELEETPGGFEAAFEREVRR